MANFWLGAAQGLRSGWDMGSTIAERKRKKDEKEADKLYAEGRELEKMEAQASGLGDVAEALDEEQRKEEWKKAFPNRPFIPAPIQEEAAQTKRFHSIRDAVVEKAKVDRLLARAAESRTARVSAAAHERSKELGGTWEERSAVQEKQFNKTFGHRTAQDALNYDLAVKRLKQDKGKTLSDLKTTTKYKRKLAYDNAKEIVTSVQSGSSPYIEWIKARAEGEKLYKAILNTDVEDDSRAKIVGLGEALESIKAKWLDGADSAQAKSRNSAITKLRDSGRKDIDLLYKSWDREKEPNLNPKDFIERVFLDQDNVVTVFDAERHDRSESWERIVPAKRSKALQMYSHVIVHKIDPITKAQTQSQIPAPVRRLPGEETDPLRGGGQGDAEELNRAYLTNAAEKIIPQEILPDGRLRQSGRDKVLSWLRLSSAKKAGDQPHPKWIKSAGRLLLPEDSQFSKEFTPADWNKLDTASGLLKALERLEGEVAPPESLPMLPGAEEGGIDIKSMRLDPAIEKKVMEMPEGVPFTNAAGQEVYRRGNKIFRVK